MERHTIPGPDLEETTPTGLTGVEDMRKYVEHQGEGKVADAAGVHAVRGERHTSTNGDLNDDASSDDPFGIPASSPRPNSSMDPTYEAGQGTANPNTGGSTNPNNAMTHANSGDETEGGENLMIDNVDNQTQEEAVDGFTDTEGETTVGSPDPGTQSKEQPLSPEEFAKAQKEARSEDE